MNLMQKLIELDNTEKIEGFVLCFKTQEGNTVSITEGNLTYIEKLGMAQVIIHDVNYTANN